MYKAPDSKHNLQLREEIKSAGKLAENKTFSEGIRGNQLN